MRQVRHARHHAVVGAASIAVGCAPIRTTSPVQAFIERVPAVEDPGVRYHVGAVEEVGAGVFDARGLGARERVAADEALVALAPTTARLVEPTSVTAQSAGAGRAPRPPRRRAPRRGGDEHELGAVNRVAEVVAGRSIAPRASAASDGAIGVECR